MAQEPTKTDYSDQRRADRDEVFLRTAIAAGRKVGISAQIVNISSHGFMARTLEPLTAESHIRILLPIAGQVGAKVVWALGGRIGCAFETPFGEADYPGVLTAIKTAKPNWQLS